MDSFPSPYPLYPIVRDIQPKSESRRCPGCAHVVQAHSRIIEAELSVGACAFCKCERYAGDGDLFFVERDGLYAPLPPYVPNDL